MIDESSTPTTETTATSAPVAPAPSSPVASAPDSRPTGPASTWDEAFARAREAAGTSDPGDESDVPSDPSALTTPTPEADAPTPAPDESPAPAGKGPIPFDRHEAILKNARTKAQHEVVQRVEQVFGPAIQLQQSLRQDPVGTLTQLIDEAMADPSLGPQIVSHAARALSQRRGRTTDSEEPQADLETADGTLVYSAGQLAKREQWVRTQLLNEIKAHTAPLEQEIQARKEAHVLGQQRAKIHETVTSRLSQWRERPGFKDHETAIAEAQQTYVDQGLDPWSAMGLAYTDVVVPHLRADTQTTLVKAAVAKAKASTTSPATTAPAPVRGIAKTWDEAFAMAGLRRT